MKMARLKRFLSISFIVYLNFIEYVKTEITNANSAIPTVKEHDVLESIKIPFEDSKTMYFDQGLDGFPAFGILPGSDIKAPFRLYLPEKLYPEFSITCTIALKSRNGGFIFAVVNPMETVVEFGIQVHPVETNRMNISLFYTDVGKFSSSKIVGSFLVPYQVGKFTKFAVQVTGDTITLFYNCNKFESLYVKRDTSELLFDPASILYVGQAGPIIKENIEGSLQEVRIYDAASYAEYQCDNAFQDFDAGSGDETTEFNNVDSHNIEILQEEDGSGTSVEFPGNTFDGSKADSDLSPPPFPPPPPKPSGQDAHQFVLKGEKGDRGPPGESIRGPPGLPGPVGPPGLPGVAAEGIVLPQGPPPTCSCNLTTLLESNELRGPPGPAGVEGKQGLQGLPGVPGERGERGVAGPVGEKGERGDVGAPGPEGIQGQKGDPGMDGVAGIPGPSGPPGPPGPPGVTQFTKADDSTAMIRPGPPGVKGDRGIDGTPGLKGEPGVPGSKGLRGEKGMKGLKGDKGNQGPYGKSGVKGDTGLRGRDGTPGSPGANGRPGPKGEKGDTGMTGPPGPPGNMLDIEELRNALSKGERNVLGAIGEKGQTGEKGEKGERGEIGLPGINGDKGDMGSIGITGGKGDKGDRGEPGPPGPAILTASDKDTLIVKGEKGEAGKRGRRGKTGLPGPIGPPGPPGLLSDGTTSKGEKGEKGEPGKDGRPAEIDRTLYTPVPGPPGPPGPPGTPGVSIVGPKGEPGEPGLLPYDPSYGEVNYTPSSRTDPSRQPYYNRQAANPDVVKVVPGAIVFSTKEAMLKVSAASPLGTISYIIDEQAVLVRVNNGWQYLQLGSVVTLPASTTSLPYSTSEGAPHFEASNLINNYVKDSPNLRLASLNEPYSGDMHGVQNADYSCYRQSRKAGLKGTFRAFLASRIQNIDSIVRYQDRDLPVVNLKGEVLFNSWKSLFNGDGGVFSQQPRIHSFSGKNIFTDLSWPQKIIWHGAYTNGKRAMDSYCDAWNTGSTDKVALASSLFTNKLLSQEEFSCNNRFAVLCIEVTTQQSRRRRRRYSHGYFDVKDEDAELTFEEYHHLIDNLNESE